MMLLSVACGSQCAAEVIAYDNIGPVSRRQGYYLGSGNNISGEAKLAQRFTPTTSGQLSKLELTMYFMPFENSALQLKNIDELTLSIVPDENGKPGATNLWSEVFINKTEVSGIYPSSFNVANGLSLDEGKNYWLVAATTSEGMFPYTWWLDGSENRGTTAQNFIKAPAGAVTGEWLVNYQWNPQVKPPQLGLRVSVHVPEPAAAALMIIASATLLTVRRRTISI